MRTISNEQVSKVNFAITYLGQVGESISCVEFIELQ